MNSPETTPLLAEREKERAIYDRATNLYMDLLRLEQSMPYQFSQHLMEAHRFARRETRRLDLMALKAAKEAAGKKGVKK